MWIKTFLFEWLKKHYQFKEYREYKRQYNWLKIENEKLEIEREKLRKPPKPTDPINKEQAKNIIEQFTPEYFKLIIEEHCLIERNLFIDNQLRHNKKLLHKYRSLGFGYSVQVRIHYIKVIQEVQAENL